jgi:DNA-binding PadR family transcriptional regulator
MYGYELISALEKRGGRPFQLKEGTLYPVLYLLSIDH